MVNHKAGQRPFKFKPWLGLRRIAPFQKEHNANGSKIRVFGGRLILWVLSVLIIGWVSFSAIAYLFIKYKREYSDVRYEHIVLYPWKKNEYRYARCRFLLEKGKSELADKKYLDAFNNIRLGLLEVPEDTEARINIVKFYIALKRYDLAEATLAEGLEYNMEKHEYIMTYFRFLFVQQRDDRAIEISKQLQKSNLRDPSVRHTLIMAQASAHYFRGRYLKALEVIQSEIALDAPDAVLLSAQIKWQIGEKEKALSILADLSTRDIKESAEIYRIRVEYLKELGRLSDVRRIAILRQVEHPEDPAGFLDEITTCDPATESVRLAGAISEVFNRFPDSAPAMSGLAQIAASTGQVDLAWRVYRQCKAKDLPWLPSATAVIESNLVAKRFADALAAIQTVVTDNEAWAKANGTQLDAFRSIANYGLGDKSLSELQLQNFLNDKQANPASFYPVASQMARAGALDQARTILAAAVKANPLDQASLTRLVELDLEQLDTQSLVINTDRLLVMRKPEPDFLRKIQSTLQSDRYIFEGSDALLQKISARLAQNEEG